MPRALRCMHADMDGLQMMGVLMTVQPTCSPPLLTHTQSQRHTQTLMRTTPCLAAWAKPSTLRALWLSSERAMEGTPLQAASRAAPTVPL